MYRVSEIYIYPIKGLRGISVAKSEVMPAGLKYDRRWMIVDEEARFMSQRQIPQMALLKTAIIDNKLLINYKEDCFQFELGQSDGKTFQASIWDDFATVHEVDIAISAWLSKIFHKKLMLVHLFDEFSRVHFSSKTEESIHVSLADGYPYLLIGTQSLGLLNDRLDVNVGINRFRPNIVIETLYPHEEDGWKTIAFANSSFQIVKSCARCQVVTIDQESGEKNQIILKTLSEYRKEGNKVYFGVNMVSQKNGILSVGDVILNF